MNETGDTMVLPWFGKMNSSLIDWRAGKDCLNPDMRFNYLVSGMVMFLFFVIIIISMGPAQGETLIVDQDGSLGYDSIQEAINDAEEEDVIRVWEGSYNENIIVDKALTIEGNGTTKTVIHGIDTNNSEPTIHLYANRTIIEDLTIDGKGKGPENGIFVNSSFNTIREVNVTRHERGIFLEESQRNILQNVIVENNDIVGIELYRSHFNLISHSISIKAGQKSGLRLSFSDNNSFTQNEFSRNGRSGIRISHSENNLIYQNVCERNDFHGISLFGAGKNHIKTNQLRNNSEFGIDLRESGKYGLGSNKIHYNNITSNRIGINVYRSFVNDRASANSIFNNTDWGVNAWEENSDGNILNASNNWWGHDSGPFHEFNNPYGKGDNVTDKVTFDPWTGKTQKIPWTGKYNYNGRNWYVDALAETGGDGSLSDPFDTIRDAVESANDGDIVRIAASEYYEKLVIDRVLWLKGESRNSTILYTEEGEHKLTITSSWVTIENLRFDDTQGYEGETVRITGSSVRILSSNFDQSRGLQLGGVNNCTLKGNFFMSGGAGIELEGSSSNLITNNTFWSKESSGIRLEDGSENNTINHNHFIKVNGTGTSLFHAHNNTIENNLFKRGDAYGVYLDHSDDNQISRNEFIENEKAGIEMYDAMENEIFDNSFTENGKGIVVLGASQYNKCEDNNFFDNLGYAIRADNNEGIRFNATNNWWGNVSGPYHPVYNSDGSGDSVSDDVTFSPWQKVGYGNRTKYASDKDVPPRTWYVKKDGTGDAQSVNGALGKARHGDTIMVEEGEFGGSIEIRKSVSIVGAGVGKTTLDTWITLEADHVNFTGFTIESRKDYGIQVNRHSNLRLEDLYFENLDKCLTIEQSEGSTIANITCVGSNDWGLMIRQVFNSTIYGNNFSKANDSESGGSGILISSSHYNKIIDNRCVGNTNYGIRISSSFNNTIKNNNLSNNGEAGIELSYSSTRNQVIQNTIFSNGIGIIINSYSSSNNISDNHIDNFTERRGFWHSMAYRIIMSHDNVHYNNSITGYDIGVKVEAGAKNNLFRNNQIFDNNHVGIFATHNERTVDAIKNWWGHESGPYHNVDNRFGQCNNVTDNVEFDPWLGKPVEFKTKKPEVTITFPSNDSIVSKEVIILGSVDRGTYSVTRVEVSLDGVNWTGANGTESWNYAFDSTNHPNGDYVLSARVYYDGKYSNRSDLFLTIYNSGSSGGDGGNGGNGGGRPSQGEQISMPVGNPAAAVTGLGMVAVAGLAVAYYNSSETGRYNIGSLLAPLMAKRRRRRMDDPLAHETRGQIIGALKMTPGAHYCLLQKKLQLNNGNLAHHLRILEREGFVASKKMGRLRCFYIILDPEEASGMLEWGDEKVTLPEGPPEYFNDTRQQVQDLISRKPGISQSDLAEFIGITSAAVKYHIDSLLQAGAIRKERHGIFVAYFPQ